MNQIEKICAEIERRIKEGKDGYRGNLKSLLSFIESLEKEQDVNLDFQRFSKEMDAVFALPAAQTKNTENEPLNWEYAIAKHFYELGCRKKDNAPKIKGWVARYANGDLEVGREKPRYYEDGGKTYITNPCDTIPLDKSWFPELHWLDEPIEVELTIHRV